MNVRPDFHLIELVSATIRDMLGDDFDSETFFDTLDGETDAMDMIGHLIRQRVEADAHAAASKEAAAIYAARASRLTERSKAITKALGAILDATGERKVTHPLATISRTAGRMSLRITDETAIPTQLTKTVTSPDTAAIKAQIEAGEIVPGAELVRGDDGLTVRIK